MTTIVISYRREDSIGITGRIFDRLEPHFGQGSVFMDIDFIPVGRDFREHIRATLDRCDVMLAIIGPEWRGPLKSGGNRIDQETDWVHIEVETALAKNIPVIPVLVDGAEMPKPAELPPPLRDLAFRNAAIVDTGIDFRPHMERLIRALDNYAEPGQVPREIPAAPPYVARPSRRPGFSWNWQFLLALGIIALGFFGRFAGLDPISQTSQIVVLAIFVLILFAWGTIKQRGR